MRLICLFPIVHLSTIRYCIIFQGDYTHIGISVIEGVEVCINHLIIDLMCLMHQSILMVYNIVFGLEMKQVYQIRCLFLVIINLAVIIIVKSRNDGFILNRDIIETFNVLGW